MTVCISQEWMASARQRNGFYVSAILGPRRALVAGPYATHEQALAMVEPTRTEWEKRDPRAAFAAWGTSRVGPKDSGTHFHRLRSRPAKASGTF